MTVMTQSPAILAVAAPVRATSSIYPEPFASRMAGRSKQPLGDLFGLSNFGVNLTRLAPGAVSALHHRHSRQDEFVYVVEGEVVLFTDAGGTRLTAGMCAGFPAGGSAHHLQNRSDAAALVLVVGDRSVGDEVSYPDDDLRAVPDGQGSYQFIRKNGSPYPM